MIVEEHRGFRVVVVAIELPGGTPKVEARIEPLGRVDDDAPARTESSDADVASAERLALEAAKLQINWQLSSEREGLGAPRRAPARGRSGP